VIRRPLRRTFLPVLLLNGLLALLAFSAAAAQAPLLVGYFGQWGLYSDPQYTLKDLAVDHKAAMLDQLNYAQGFVAGGRCSIADPNADLNHSFTAAESVDGTPDDPSSSFRGHMHQLAELKRAYPRLKVLISLEGHAPDFAYDAQPDHREAFVQSCVDLFLKGNLALGVTAPGLFDGIDLDWEYPKGPDAANFLALLGEFRHQMDRLRPGLKLSVAVGPSPRMYDGTDFAQVAAQVDEVGLMTYDFAGPWMQHTGFLAPLYNVSAAEETAERTPTPTGANPTASTTRSANEGKPAGASDASVPAPRPPPRGGAAGSAQAFIAAGVPASKLLLGVPFYGYGWTLVPEEANGVFQEGNPVRGDRPYSYIQTLILHSRVFRDAVSQTPWLFDGDAFWTFDDPVSVAAKARYVRDHGLGGIMIWELSGDTPQAALMSAAHHALEQPDAVHARP
jgi:chitinase